MSKKQTRKRLQWYDNTGFVSVNHTDLRKAVPSGTAFPAVSYKHQLVIVCSVSLSKT